MSSTLASGPGSGRPGSVLLMAGVLHLVDVLLDAGHRLLRNGVCCNCFLLSRPAMPAAANSTTPMTRAAAQSGNTSARAAIAEGDQRCQPEDGQQTRPAEQPGAKACVLRGFAKLLLRQLHFMSNQPRRLPRPLAHQLPD